MDTEYAWVIDMDHLFDEATSRPYSDFSPEEDEAGTEGPSNAPNWLHAFLACGAGEGCQQLSDHGPVEVLTFTMYDDDGIPYYSGRLAVSGEITEEAVYSPLRDYGMPNAGAVTVRYPNHPEYDCG